MHLLPLGHTECLLDISNSQGKNVRVLIDSWLSDFVVGDMMARSPRLQIDWSILAPDVVYVSHAHTDHLDPYTLVEIYRHISPILLIPETLAYLVPVLQKYLPTAKIEILREKTPFVFQGITFTGTCFISDTLTNEEDVMTLSVASESEMAFFEIDTIPPDDEDSENRLYRLFTAKNFTHRIYVASRNELEGFLPLFDARTSQERKKKRQEYIQSRLDEIEYAEGVRQDRIESGREISILPGFNRIVLGQGIVFPLEVSSTLAQLPYWTLPELVDAEKNALEGKMFPIIPGRPMVAVAFPRQSLKIAGVSLKKVDSPSGKEAFLSRGDIPMDPSERDIFMQQSVIAQLLHERFLPYWFSRDIGNLKEALLKSATGYYHIGIRYGNEMKNELKVYAYSFAMTRFTVIPFADLNQVDELYWANDIEDFLGGKQELYSNFLHALDPKKTYRLWTMLGANFLNNDFVMRKYAYHFERAISVKTPADFVLPFCQRMLSIG